MSTATSVSDPAVRSRSRTGMAIPAYLLGTLGAVAVIAGTIQTGRILVGPGNIVSPVFENPRRLAHLETLDHLATSYSVSFFILLGWFVFAILLGVLFLALVHILRRHAPIRALVSGVFLAGSLITAVLVGTSEMKVVEFAVQSTGASPAEQEWVGAGINYLNQLHLFYVSAWMLCLGLGWFGLGLTATAAGPRVRNGAALVLAGGVTLTISVLARAWLPGYGPEAPALIVAMGEPLATLGIGAGLIGCALLWKVMVPGRGSPRSMLQT